MPHLPLLLLLLGHVAPVEPLRRYFCEESWSQTNCLETTECKTNVCLSFTFRYKQESGTMKCIKGCPENRLKLSDNKTMVSITCTACYPDLCNPTVSEPRAPLPALPSLLLSTLSLTLL